jgi:hypothetical protein
MKIYLAGKQQTTTPLVQRLIMERITLPCNGIEDRVSGIDKVFEEIASFTAREKDWGSAEKQEEWIEKNGTKGRLLSYYAIANKQAESEGSFNYFIQKGKNEKTRNTRHTKSSKTSPSE